MTIRFSLGNDNFRKLRQEQGYYIDKTAFISELLEANQEVSLLTRPRRFGKTLTMSMLEDFFDITRDSRADFEGLAVAENMRVCENWMNQWPVLFLTLKSVEGLKFSGAYGMLVALLADLCKKYSFLEDSSLVDEDDKAEFKALKAQKADAATVNNSLYILMRMLHDHYGRQVILLIDEYDVPLAKANEGGYYPEMLDIIRMMLGKVLKTNEFLKIAVITGCLKIAKESIFTGTNNFVSDTVSGGRFHEYIGFTEEEVHRILQDTGFMSHADIIKAWYDGYLFGDTEVYCPWDVLNYVSELQQNPNAVPKSYWENTSHNGIIRRFIEREDLWRESHINEDFEALLAGKSITKTITENLTYDVLHSSADNLWSLLYMSGYLTRAAESVTAERVALRIPNKELHRLFRMTVMEWFEASVKTTDRSMLFDALWNCKDEVLTKMISDRLFQTISFHDFGENFYHAFLVGILSFAGYKVRSNDESGEGRSDILLLDERNGRAVVIECKVSKTVRDMNKMCEEALMQIRNMRYAESLEDEYQDIVRCGICFYKKRCLVKAVKQK